MTFWQLIVAEFRAVISNRAVMIMLVGGALGYSLVYPLPYQNQIPREQKVAVVDLDGTALSRKLVNMVQATPEVSIVSHPTSLKEAEAQLVNGQVSGILVVPENFNRDLRLGRRPVLSYSGDASYFLVYGSVAKGLTRAGGTLAAGSIVLGDILDGVPARQAAKTYTSVRLVSSPLFNQTMGYMNYVVPPIFVMILHQLMVVVVGALGGTQNELDAQGVKGYWHQVGFVELLCARILLMVGLFIPLVLYYFGVAFSVYGIAQLAAISQLVLLMVPVLVAAAALGVVIGQLVPRRELASLLVLLSSFPLVFSAGFIWPTEAIPAWLLWLVQWVPVIPAMQAALRLNQMGADFQQILPLWYQLCSLAALYLLLAVVIDRVKQSRAAVLQ